MWGFRSSPIRRGRPWYLSGPTHHRRHGNLDLFRCYCCRSRTTKTLAPSPLGVEIARRGRRIHRLVVFDLPGRSASGDDFRHVQRRPLVGSSSSTLTFSLPPLCCSSGSTRPRWLPKVFDISIPVVSVFGPLNISIDCAFFFLK